MTHNPLSKDGQPVSATPARAATVSAVLRKAGFTRSVTKRSPNVKFAIPTAGFHAQQWDGCVRVSSTFSAVPVQRYADALTAAGYVVEPEGIGNMVRVYRAATPTPKETP